MKQIFKSLYCPDCCLRIILNRVDKNQLQFELFKSECSQSIEIQNWSSNQNSFQNRYNK